MPCPTYLPQLILKNQKMFKFIIPAFILIGSQFSAQVIIGSGKTTPSGNAVSLEFGTEAKGMVLPFVISAAEVDAHANDLGGGTGNAVPGTLIFDSQDFRIKVRRLSGWQDLSIIEDVKANLTIQNPFTEDLKAKVSIGSPTAAKVNGILVLEDSNKAMILPTVTNTDEIVNPSAGMMVYVEGASKKTVAFFNGTSWTYWE